MLELDINNTYTSKGNSSYNFVNPDPNKAYSFKTVEFKGNMVDGDYKTDVSTKTYLLISISKYLNGKSYLKIELKKPATQGDDGDDGPQK